MDTHDIINWDEALRLANQNHELAEEMLKMLVERLPEDQQDILDCYAQQNFDKLKQLTHKLRGALCYCGVPRLRHAVEQLDNALKQPSPKHQMDELVQQFAEEVQTLMSAYATKQ